MTTKEELTQVEQTIQHTDHTAYTYPETMENLAAIREMLVRELGEMMIKEGV